MNPFKNKLENLMCWQHNYPVTLFNIFEQYDNRERLYNERLFCYKCVYPKNSINVDDLFQAYQQLKTEKIQTGFRELYEEFNSQVKLLKFMIQKFIEDFFCLIQSKSKTLLLKEFDELINDPNINETSVNKILKNISQFTVGKVEEKYIYIEEEVSDQNFARVQELSQKLSAINKFWQQTLLINYQNNMNQENNGDQNIANLYFLEKQIQSNFKFIKNMQFNHDLTKLLIKGDDKQTDLEVWNKKGNIFLQSNSLNCHKFGILHLCCSRQLDIYFTAGIDDKSTDYNKPYTYSIKIWSQEADLITRNHCAIHQTYHNIGCMILSNQEQYLAIGDGCSVKVFKKYNTNQYIAIQTPNQQKELVKCLAFDRFDSIICCGTENSEIIIYNLQENKLSLNQKIQAGYIPKQLRLVNDGFMLCLNRDGILQVFKNDAKQFDFKCVQTILENNAKIRSMAIHSNQTQIVLGWDNNLIEFMELTQGKLVMKSRHKQQSYVEYLCFSPIQSILAVTNENKIMIYQQQQ